MFKPTTAFFFFWRNSFWGQEEKIVFILLEVFYWRCLQAAQIFPSPSQKPFKMPRWAPSRRVCDETRSVLDKCCGTLTAGTLLSCHLPFSSLKSKDPWAFLVMELQTVKLCWAIAWHSGKNGWKSTFLNNHMSWSCLFSATLNGHQLAQFFFLLKVNIKSSPFFDISFIWYWKS